MNKITLLIVSLLTYSLYLYSSNPDFSLQDQKDNFSVKMAMGWLKYNDGDFYGALRIFRSVYEEDPNNGYINYRMGQCYVALNEMKNALPHLEKAMQVDTLLNKDLYLLLGKVYQYEEKLDDAINAYYKYKNLLSPKQLERHSVNILLRQCLTAKELMSNPVDVKITNMGNVVNSKFTDACPSITADGKILIFTTRRPETKGGRIDPSNDEYFEDVYISLLDENTKEWSKAIPIPGSINTEEHDANLSISPDGNTIFIYKNILDETRSGDIYVSKKKEDGWSKPQALDEKNVNSSYFESSASVTADGNTLFFVSEREDKGIGRGDIYFSKRMGDVWTKPENLGPAINSVDDEIGVSIHPNGKILFFSSDGHNTMGGHDIFMSVLEEGKWSEPINLGYPINTPKEEIHFVLTTNGNKAFISSSREGGLGKTDIYEIDMTRYFESNKLIDRRIASVLSGPPLSIVKGTVVDATTSEPIKTEISIKQLGGVEKTTTIFSDEKGEYFITLPSDENYEIIINHSDYKPFSTKFKLPKSGMETSTITKHLILNKK